MQWVGVDVGGTFTDAVAFDDKTDTLTYAKVPSTPANPTDGVIAALDSVQIDLKQIERFVHGITIGTNAILQRKGATVWMLVSKGFRDVLEIARTNRPVLYNIKTLKPPPIVPRTQAIEIDERLMYDGTVYVPLDLEQVRSAADQIPAGSDIGVAVCFLHSYAYPEHEQQAAEVLRELRPELFVCTSASVLSQYREYERFNTAALNAYIGPLMKDYLETLGRGLTARGYSKKVFIMTSNGGVSTAERAQRLPISTVLSGPAGGVAATVDLGSRLGIENLITYDMGGTSTDVCLIERLQIPVTNEQRIGDYANRTPQIEINAVGAGGGSIGWLDAGEILKVGPHSAGAAPGPACYGQGGDQPTVTDANLVLQRLRPDSTLAGHLRLDRDRAIEALQPIMQKLDLDAPTLADGIIRIAVARMVTAIKEVSIARGFDPRDFALCAYGGAGPMHATMIADELEIPRVVVPVGPGNFAAFGSLISDIRQDTVLTRTLQVQQSSYKDIEIAFEQLERDGRENLLQEGVDAAAIEMRRSLGMRYLGQSWELEVDLPPTVRTVEDLNTAFHEVHDRRFGHKAGEATEIVNFRITAIGRVTKPALPEWSVGGTIDHAQTDKRPVYFDGEFVDVPIYNRTKLPLGGCVPGPAIIIEDGATTVLPPAWQANVIDFGNLVLERR